MAGAADPQSIALGKAIAAGELNEIRKLIASGVNPNTSISVGALTNSPTRMALPPLLLVTRVYTRSPKKNEIIELLLSLGANPNVASEAGNTAIHAALLNGDLHQMRILVDGGANPNYSLSPTRRSALGLSFLLDHDEWDSPAVPRLPFVELLLRAGADPNGPVYIDRQERAIHLAAVQLECSAILALLAAGADPEPTLGSMRTPLYELFHQFVQQDIDRPVNELFPNTVAGLLLAGASPCAILRGSPPAPNLMPILLRSCERYRTSSRTKLLLASLLHVLVAAKTDVSLTEPQCAALCALIYEQPELNRGPEVEEAYHSARLMSLAIQNRRGAPQVKL